VNFRCTLPWPPMSTPQTHSSNKLGPWYDRNVTAGPAVKKFREGTYKNCSAMDKLRDLSKVSVRVLGDVPEGVAAGPDGGVC
jgi:hypothetical protein